MRRRALIAVALVLAVACSDESTSSPGSAASVASSSATDGVDSRATAQTSTVRGSTTTASSIASTTVAPGTTTASAHGRFEPVPVDPPPTEQVTTSESAATGLDALQGCDPDSPATPAVVLSWEPGAGDEQLVAVATLPDGFDTGRYTVSEELAGDLATYSISPVEPGGVYRWRVLTWNGSGWWASEIGMFTGPTCVLDSPSSP